MTVRKRVGRDFPMGIEAATMKRHKRAMGILAVCGVLLAAGLSLWRWLETAQPQVCRLPDGSTATLLGTTYGRHHQWTSRVRVQGFWDELKALFHPEWDTSQLDTPTDALVLWIRSEGVKGMPLFIDFTVRAEVSDAAGNRQVVEVGRLPFFESKLASGMTPLILPTFPRRGKELTVRVYRLHTTYLRPDAEFHVSNPIARNYPRWTPGPIPATQTSGDLQVTLTG